MSQESEVTCTDDNFFHNEYTAHIVALAQAHAKSSSKNNRTHFIVPSQAQWTSNITQEYERFIAVITQQAVKQGSLRVELPSMREWFVKYNKARVEASQIIEASISSTAPVSVLAAAAEATASIGSISRSNSKIIPINKDDIDHAQPVKTTSSASNPLERKTEVTEESTTQYIDSVTTTDKLAEHFLGLFKAYNVSSAIAASAIDPPSHLSVECLLQLERDIKAEVYNRVKYSHETKDPQTGEIVIACIDYQDYQRSCGVYTECGCYDKYKVPHFFFSMEGMRLSKEQIECMTSDELTLARANASSKSKDTIINCDKNKVSNLITDYMTLIKDFPSASRSCFL